MEAKADIKLGLFHQLFTQLSSGERTRKKSFKRKEFEKIRQEKREEKGKLTTSRYMSLLLLCSSGKVQGVLYLCDRRFHKSFVTYKKMYKENMLQRKCYLNSTY